MRHERLSEGAGECHGGTEILGPAWPSQRATPEGKQSLQECKASTTQWSYNAYIEPFLDIAQGLEQSIAPIKLDFKDG